MQRKIFFRAAALITLFGSFFALLFVLQTHQFTIRAVTCQTGNAPCPQDVSQQLNTLVGQSLFFAHISQTTEHVLSQNPALSHPRITKHFPDQLAIQFDELTPAYQLELNTQFFQVETLGNIIAVTAQQSALPTIIINAQTFPNLAVHQQLSATLHDHFLALATFLTEHPLTNAKIVMDSATDMHVELADGKVAQMRVDQAETDIQKLEFVLNTVDFSHFKQPIKIIDVRFKYPVLKT